MYKRQTVNWVDSQGTAHTESKTVSAGTTGLFTQKGTTSTYTTTIPIELSEDDVQYAVTIQFLKEDGGQLSLIHISSDITSARTTTTKADLRTLSLTM